MKIVITGGAGSLASDIIPGLVSHGHDILSLDHFPLAEKIQQLAAAQATPSGGSIEHKVADLNDVEVLSSAVENADAIIHLAGIPLEDEWPRVLAANVDLTQRVLQAATERSVRRLVYASSVHATGFTPIPTNGRMLSPNIPVNPNTFYGATKAAGEALCRYYTNLFNIEVLNVRICSRFALPQDSRMLSTWLSPRDAVELFHLGCCQALPEHYWSVWGVSANTRSWFDNLPGKAIGFTPKDDAELYANEVMQFSTAERAADWSQTIGGQFSSSNPPRMKG